MQFFDIILPKTFEVPAAGAIERRTTWNRVGRAWKTKAGDGLRMEIFLFPEQAFLISFKEKQAAATLSKSAEQLADDFATFLASGPETIHD